jgi:hypothetical protein
VEALESAACNTWLSATKQIAPGSSVLLAAALFQVPRTGGSAVSVTRSTVGREADVVDSFTGLLVN